ncbi:class I SAM-dependent methyltransferase [Candidatus Saccharibacteria bacterium]|nr:class I SAM-dependent methyltransferase [Candidatus Saccharibacteria bacterium]
MSYDSQIAQREIDVIIDELAKSSDVAGDVVEFGCYEGDTSVILAREMQDQPDKWLWLYDSFAGLPPKTAADQSAAGWRFKEGELKASPDQVAHKFKKYKLPDPVIKQAWFDELDSVADLPKKISFALLDGDFYESIKTSLALVAPKMQPGAKIIIHDYRNPQLPGSAKAVNEFLNANPELTFRLRAGLAIIDF